MNKQFTPRDIEKIIMRLYMDMSIGKLYEDRVCKEVFILNSILKTMELDFQMKQAKPAPDNEVT